MSLNDILFVCVCGAAIYARSISAMLFCSLYAVHSLYSPYMEQWQKYVFLILIDSAAAFIACAVGPLLDYFRRMINLPRWLPTPPRNPSRSVVLTGVFSGAFLVVNCVGLVLWYNYIQPATYDAVCSAVYIAMMAAFIDEGSNGRLRLAVYRLAGSVPRVAVRKGVGLHHKDADKI